MRHLPRYVRVAAVVATCTAIAGYTLRAASGKPHAGLVAVGAAAIAFGAVVLAWMVAEA